MFKSLKIILFWISKNIFFVLNSCSVVEDDVAAFSEDVPEFCLKLKKENSLTTLLNDFIIQKFICYLAILKA
jgi:hypothetical protein